MGTDGDFQVVSDQVLKLMDEGAFAQAQAAAKQLTAAHSEHPGAWSLLGSVWLALGDVAEAEACFHRALELGGEDWWCCYSISTVQLLRGDMEGAIAWCQRALKCKPEEPLLHMRLVDAYTYRGALEQAVKEAKKAVKVATGTPEELRARLLLGNLYLVMQSLAEAAGQFRAAVALESSNTDAWANLGHCYSRLGRPEEALNAFRKAIELAPRDPGLLYNLGDAYLAVGQSEKAVGPLMQAVQYRPDFSLASYDLSLAFFELDKYPEGAAAARAALRGDEKMESQQSNLGLGATQNLGICLMNQGKLEDALACFERNLSLLAPNYFNRGLTLFRMGRYNEAVRDFERALELQPDEAEYLDLLGQSYWELGQPDRGERWLRRAVKTDPNYAVGYYDLGIRLAKTKAKRTQAQRCFERALSLDSKMVEAHFALACLHAVAGKKKVALECLKKSLEKGFQDFERIDAARDLRALRSENEFRQLVAKFRKA